jgi:hypothetical protein
VPFLALALHNAKNGEPVNSQKTKKGGIPLEQRLRFFSMAFDGGTVKASLNQFKAPFADSLDGGREGDQGGV